jgi:hypothetical protein
LQAGNFTCPDFLSMSKDFFMNGGTMELLLAHHRHCKLGKNSIQTQKISYSFLSQGFFKKMKYRTKGRVWF